MDIEPILEQHRAEREYLGELLLLALQENMPWGLKVELPNGASAVLTKLGFNIIDQSTPFQPPVGDQSWRFMFDFKLKNCDQDHIEITTEITGGGGDMDILDDDYRDP